MAAAAISSGSGCCCCALAPTGAGACLGGDFGQQEDPCCRCLTALARDSSHCRFLSLLLAFGRLILLLLVPLLGRSTLAAAEAAAQGRLEKEMASPSKKLSTLKQAH